MLSLGLKAGYLEARELAAERGRRLPSNVLHDDCLVISGGWEEMRDLYPAWAREIAVYPQKNCVFYKGADVIDSEIGWVFPASYIPREAIGVRGVGLIIDPLEIREEQGLIIVHPAEVKVLRPFIQDHSACGRVDTSTGVPIALPPRSEAEERRFYRLECEGVRPIVRFINSDDTDYWRKGVSGLYGPNSMYGVALDSSSESKK
jgi:hypothetical protein